MEQILGLLAKGMTFESIVEAYPILTPNASCRRTTPISRGLRSSMLVRFTESSLFAQVTIHQTK